MSYPTKKDFEQKKAHEKAFKSGNKQKTQSNTKNNNNKKHKDKQKLFFVEYIKTKKIAMGIFTNRTHNGHKL